MFEIFKWNISIIIEHFFKFQVNWPKLTFSASFIDIKTLHGKKRSRVLNVQIEDSVDPLEDSWSFFTVYALIKLSQLLPEKVW